jgi:hypothetical protein
VTWAEVAKVPLCLLTPDMQNRRIIERLLGQAGGNAQPTLESNSMILLYSHVRTGRWASVMVANAPLKRFSHSASLLRNLNFLSSDKHHAIDSINHSRQF